MKTQIWIPEYEPPGTLNSEMSRRNFLKFGMSSFLGLVAMQHLQSAAFAQMENIVPRATRCIVLFMNGGPSQLDTFDPKPGDAKRRSLQRNSNQRGRNSILPAPAVSRGASAPSRGDSLHGVPRGKS